MKTNKTRRMIICIKMLICIFITMLSVTSCGGGGGGGVGAPAVSYGVLDGYVYVPYGSGRVVFAATTPSGYKPLSGATVTATLNQFEKSATTSSSGYFMISSLKTGTYAVSVSKTGYGKYQTSAVVKANETKSVGGGEISLIPSNSGNITVTANISGGTVILDGENTGLTIPSGLGRTFENVSTGVHVVSISQTGFEGGNTQNVTVSSGETAFVDFFMMPSGNRAPVATVSTDRKGFVGFDYALDGSASTDPDGDTLKYSWQQVSGPSSALTSVNEASPNITPSASSTYKFRLTVSDGYLTDSTEIDFSAMKLAGRIVGDLYLSKSDVYVLHADGSDFSNITNNSISDDFQSMWSPNGGKIVFYSGKDGNGIYEINEDGTNRRKIVSDASDPIYSLNGQEIAYVKGNSIYKANVDGTNETFLVSPGSNYTGDLSLSPDGETIAFSGEFGTWNSEIMTINWDGSGYKRITNNSNLTEVNPEWLPNKQIMFGVSNFNNNFQLYVMDADGANTEKLCSDNIIRKYQIVSSDGKIVFYYNGRYPNYKIYAMYIDCSGITEILTGKDYLLRMYTP